MALVVKNLPADAGDMKDTGSIPGSDGLGSDNGGVQFCICLSVVVVQLLSLV